VITSPGLLSLASAASGTPQSSSVPPCGIRRGVVTARWSGPSDARARKAEAERIAAELKSAKSEFRRQRSAAKATEHRVGDLEGKLKELSASLTPHQIE
jgi:hypothetical protein